MYIEDEELIEKLAEMKKEMQQIENIIHTKQQQQEEFESFVTGGAVETEILPFQDSWLTLENYQLKILVITSILAEKNFAFRGKLDILCEWLGVKKNTYNKTKIINAINKLQEQEFIYYKKDNDGKTYTITITELARETTQVCKILKDWVLVFKNYNKDEKGNIIDKNISVDWVNILKVFVFFYQNGTVEFTQKELAEKLNIKSESIISKSIKAIKQCNIERIHFQTNIIRKKYKDGQWRTLGTEVCVGYEFSKSK